MTTSGYGGGRQEDLLANAGAQEIALLDGRFALEDVIGRGGIADVYLGRDEALRRPVAVKILREITTDPLARARSSSFSPWLSPLVAGIFAEKCPGTPSICRDGTPLWASNKNAHTHLESE
jgi:serine/threonine protein kinase